jgi:hypothetical protein
MQVFAPLRSSGMPLDPRVPSSLAIRDFVLGCGCPLGFTPSRVNYGIVGLMLERKEA